MEITRTIIAMPAIPERNSFPARFKLKRSIPHTQPKIWCPDPTPGHRSYLSVKGETKGRRPRPRSGAVLCSEGASCPPWGYGGQAPKELLFRRRRFSDCEAAPLRPEGSAARIHGLTGNSGHNAAWMTRGNQWQDAKPAIDNIEYSTSKPGGDFPGGRRRRGEAFRPKPPSPSGEGRVEPKPVASSDERKARDMTKRSALVAQRRGWRVPCPGVKSRDPSPPKGASGARGAKPRPPERSERPPAF